MSLTNCCYSAKHNIITQERFEHAKVEIRSHNSKKDSQSNDQNKITRQITVNKILHRKLKIEQHENHIKDGDEFKHSGVVSSSCSTSGTQHTE
jgi:hypothetical protein